MYEVLGKLREARALAIDENSKNRSRELSLVITKIDEAILWYQEQIRLTANPVNEDSL